MSTDRTLEVPHVLATALVRLSLAASERKKSSFIFPQDLEPTRFHVGHDRVEGYKVSVLFRVISVWRLGDFFRVGFK